MLKKHYKKNKGNIIFSTIYPFTILMLIILTTATIHHQTIKILSEISANAIYNQEIERIRQSIIDLCQKGNLKVSKNSILAYEKPIEKILGKSPDQRLQKQLDNPKPIRIYKGLCYKKQSSVLYIHTLNSLGLHKNQVSRYVKEFKVEEKDGQIHINIKLKIKNKEYYDQIIIPKT